MLPLLKPFSFDLVALSSFSVGDEQVRDNDHQQREAVARGRPLGIRPGAQELESAGHQLRCGFLGVPHVQVGQVTYLDCWQAAGVMYLV